MTMESNEEENANYYWKVYFSFKNYERWYTRVIESKLNAFYTLSSEDQDCLPHFKEKCERALKCIHKNQEFFDDMLKSTPHFVKEKKIASPTSEDFQKCVSALKCMYRDWSEAGKCERVVYDTILNELKTIDVEKRSTTSVFVPGSGTTRLAYDIASLGFNTTANELTYHMLIPSYFVLNTMDKSYEIYPFIHDFQNRRCIEDAFLPISIPDIFPTIQNDGFKMIGGDFLELQLQCDIVVTCFFIDTASNIIDYIRHIDKITNKTWLTIGPLLYHHQQSIELSWEEILFIVVQKTDFTLTESNTIPSSYCADPSSMVSYLYNNSYGKFTKNK